MRPRSYLDGGTEVLPGERKFMDYAQAPTYMLARTDQLMGSERHASLAIADAIRAAGLFAVFVLVSRKDGSLKAVHEQKAGGRRRRHRDKAAPKRQAQPRRLRQGKKREDLRGRAQWFQQRTGIK